MIDTKKIQSPCKECKTKRIPSCRESCGELAEFILYLDHANIISYGIADMSNDGYSVQRNHETDRAITIKKEIKRKEK